MILMDLVPSFVVVNKVGIGTNYAVVSGKVKFFDFVTLLLLRHAFLNASWVSFVRSFTTISHGFH